MEEPRNDTFNTKTFTIKEWKESDRPREKLMALGSAALSDSELLAILIGHGNQEENAVQLCRRILRSVENDLVRLSRLEYSDLMRFKGIGEAKAVSIVAAMELGRRRQSFDIPDRYQINSSKDAYLYLRSFLQDLNHEEFWILFLDRGNKVLGQKRISSGGVSGTIVDPKLVFKPALEHYASNVILAHNHPSGNLNPSGQDLHLTEKLKKGGDYLEIKVLDHLIITAGAYYSFSDKGRM